MSHQFSSSGDSTEDSIGQCYTGESESHASKGEGFTSGHKEWRVEAEGEQIALVRSLLG